MKKTTLQQFFEVLSSKIRCCVLPKDSISNENVDGLHSKTNGGKTQERTVSFSLLQVGTATNSTNFISRFFYPFWIAFLLFAFLPSSAIGQCADNTGGQVDLRPSYTRNTCGTANDVILLGARLVASDPCNKCTEGLTTTATLILQVHNNAQSARWLGLFSDLVTTSAATCSLIRCEGPLVGNAQETFLWEDGVTTYQEIAFGTVSFKCGDALTLTNILVVFNTPQAGCPVGYQSAKWCYDTKDMNITPPLNLVLTPTPATCNGTSNGQISAAFGGGTGLEIKIDEGLFADVLTASPIVFTGLSAGSHDITIRRKNATQCFVTKSATITQPAALVASIGTPTHVNCFGGTTGSAKASATGGTSSYSYSWNTNPVQTTATASNLAAATYTVTVTDSKGCTDTEQVTITQPTAALSASATATAESCAGSDGSINLTVTGGTSRYTFNWTKVGDGTYNSTAENPSGLAAGTYNVTVTDANQCTTTASATVNGPVNCAHIFPTQTTCQDYVNKVPVLDAVCLTVASNIITNATPGVFFYYGDFTASSTGNTTITVDQIIPSNMTKYFDPQNSSNVRVYDKDCKVQKIREKFLNNGDVAITFSATSGAKYVVSVKYDVKSIIGDNAPTIRTNYTFGMRDAKANAISGTFGQIEVKNCNTTASTTLKTTAAIVPTETTTAKTTADATGFDAYPVPFKDQLTIKYKFDYKSDVKIEVFNAQGISVLSTTDNDSYLDKEVLLDLKGSRRQEQVYVVKLTTNRETITKKVMSAK